MLAMRSIDLLYERTRLRHLYVGCPNYYTSLNDSEIFSFVRDRHWPVLSLKSQRTSKSLHGQVSSLSSERQRTDRVRELVASTRRDRANWEILPENPRPFRRKEKRKRGRTYPRIRLECNRAG